MDFNYTIHCLSAAVCSYPILPNHNPCGGPILRYPQDRFIGLAKTPLIAPDKSGNYVERSETLLTTSDKSPESFTLHEPAVGGR